MTSDPFLGPRIKIERAYQHLDDLQAAETAFFNSNTPEVVIEPDIETGHQILKVRLTACPPEMLHVLAGEVIYQLRSTLDQIAVACARLSAAKPNPKRVYFPSGNNYIGFRASAKSNLAGVDIGFVKIILKLKPYDGGNEPLRSIFSLGNVDKHMELVPMANRAQVGGLKNFRIIGPRPLIMKANEPLNEGVTISDLGFDGSITPTHPDAKISLSAHVAFGNVSNLLGRPVVPTLRQLTDMSKTILDVFVTYCRNTGRL